MGEEEAVVTMVKAMAEEEVAGEEVFFFRFAYLDHPYD